MTTIPARGVMDDYRPEVEKPLIPLEETIHTLEIEIERGDLSDEQRKDAESRITKMAEEHEQSLRRIYDNLSPWQIVSQIARHPRRPQSTDYLRRICSDFCQLHGDRFFSDDSAIMTGFARIGGEKVMLVAHRKGRDTNERQMCNFGCAHPEGYRKALKNMKMAEKYGLPIVTLVDTKGAYPGIGAEERGQAEAIAVNILEMSRLRTPILSIVIGEGGSGGALGIAVADRVAMLEYAWYSVISPEGCSAILWKEANPANNQAAAEALCLTAEENLRLGVVDEIISEPLGGAHRDHDSAADILQGWIVDNLRNIKEIDIDELISKRYDRYRSMGEYAVVSSDSKIDE